MASQGLLKRLAKRREELKSKGGGGSFFTVKEGTTRMRALPVGEDVEFAKEVTYFYLGLKLGGIVSPVTIGKRCALMEAYNEMSNSKNEKDREFAKKYLKPSKKYFSPHIKYKDEAGKEIDKDAGVKLLILSGGQYQKLIDLFLDSDNGDFTDPINGYDLKYVRTGKGKQDTKYDILPGKVSKLDKEFRKVYDIEAMVAEMIPTYKETKAKLEEFLNLPQEGSDEEEPAPKKKKKNKGDI